MQQKKSDAIIFSSRTDLLANVIGVPVRELAPHIEMSPASLFSYRSGRQDVSAKAWRKLAEAEAKNGIKPGEISTQAPEAGRQNLAQKSISQSRDIDALIEEQRLTRSMLGQMSAHMELLANRIGEMSARMNSIDKRIESSEALLAQVDKKVSRDPVPPPPRKPADLFPNADRPVPPPQVKKLA